MNIQHKRKVEIIFNGTEATLNASGCTNQDLYTATVVLLAKMKTELRDPMAIDCLLTAAKSDAEKMLESNHLQMKL